MLWVSRRLKLEGHDRLVTDDRLPWHNSIYDLNPTGTRFAVHDDQQITLRPRGKYAMLCQDKSAAVGFCETDSKLIDNEESFDVCRVAVFVMDAHKKMSDKLDRVRRYLNLIGQSVMPRVNGGG